MPILLSFINNFSAAAEILLFKYFQAQSQVKGFRNTVYFKSFGFNFDPVYKEI